MSDASKPLVLYVVSQLGQGGAEQQLYYVLKYLKPNAKVLSLAPGGYWAQPIRELGYEVIELARAGSFDLNRLQAVTRWIRTLRPDILHLFMDGVPGAYGRLGAWLTRHPRLIVGMRNHPARDPGWYTWMRRLWLDRPAAIIVSNARQCQEYLIEQDKLPAHKARFIPNGLELDRFLPDSSADRKSFLPADWQDKVIVGTIGALANRKSPETFVQVAACILKECEHVRFIHAGDGPLKGMVENLSQELGISDSILFLGSRSDAPDILRAMDIFLLTSRNEGMPNVVMEAMATALPCVVTDIGDCKDLVRDGEVGYVAPVGNVTRLAEHVRTLIENESLRRKMGQKAQQIIQDYDVHKMAEQYHLLYEVVLSSVVAVN
jgi:glycosyltransferase involved in cell wall biosynthesis